MNKKYYRALIKILKEKDCSDIYCWRCPFQDTVCNKGAGSKKFVSISTSNFKFKFKDEFFRDILEDIKTNKKLKDIDTTKLFELLL